MNKKERRKSIIAKRDALPEDLRKQYSQTIANCILGRLTLPPKESAAAH